jgi:alanine-alpha-ketoisovalerate/valine-pyruvate aminotransferase
MNDKQISISPSANLSKNSERQFVVPIKKLESGESIGNICIAWPGKETVCSICDNSEK